MRKRDFGVLLIAAFAVYFTLQEEQGPFSFRKAWYHHLDGAEWDFGTDTLPQPAVADLNGDGKPEIVAATHSAKLQVLQPKPPGRPGDGFAPAKVLAEMPLAISAAQAGGSAKAVAIAVGTIDAPAQELVRPFSKQVVVVVTHGWHVLCFDHNLKLLWDRSIREEMPHHTAMSEVAIHISNHTVLKGDRGLIVVGAASHLGDISSHSALSAHLDDADPFDEELEIEAAERERRHSARLEKLDNLADAADGVDVSRHFSYYAWEGAAGALRWKHEGQDFHRDAAALAEQVIPQHNYRLDAASLAGRHYGQASCRDFRGSVLRSLPHRWARREDTRLALSHFHHHKAGHGALKQRMGARPERLGVQHLGRHGVTRGRQGTEDNKVASAISKLARKAGSGAGGTPTKGGGAPTSAEEHFGQPNVLVAHLKEGIEAIHLYTGRTICKLHLPNPGLHADLNGDGVLDHAVAHGGKPAMDLGQTAHRRVPPCWATVHSGQPPTQQLFNGSVCRGPSAFFGHPGFEEDPGSQMASIEVAPPTALPVVGRQGHVRRSRAWPVFANSRGEVSAYDAAGALQWQVEAGTSWSNSVGADDEGHAVAPTLDAIPLRTGGVAVAVLAAGAHTAALLSEHGHILDHLELPAPPVLPLLAVDFSFDRNTDIILTTREGYYGFQQVRHIGGVPFSALVGCVIAGVVVLYATKQGGGRKRKGRSTDRAD